MKPSLLWATCTGLAHVPVFGAVLVATEPLAAKATHRDVLGHSSLRIADPPVVREDRGLSQEAFADVLEVHRTYYGGVERGERNLTLKSVERIAERVGVAALQLLE